MEDAFSFSCPTRICAGAHALEHLPFELSAMGASKPMVIQDQASVEAGLGKRLTRAFLDSDMTLGLAGPVPPGPSPSPAQPSQEFAGFIRSIYTHYREKGYNAIITLGGSLAANTAKALNIAVSLGPDHLRQSQITAPLAPMIFIPTTTDAMDAVMGTTRFNGRQFDSKFLIPDMAVMDPVILLDEAPDRLLDQALCFLALGSEICGTSPSPMARAYGAAIVKLAMEALPPLRAADAHTLDQTRAGRKTKTGCQKDLVQAAVMAGSMTANHFPLYTLMLGSALAEQNPRSRGQYMLLVLPAVLELCKTRYLSSLHLHLAGDRAHAAVPAGQQAPGAIQAVRDMINTLYLDSLGAFARTLEEAGWEKKELAALGNTLSQTHNLNPSQAGYLTQILDQSFDAVPWTFKSAV